MDTWLYALSKPLADSDGALCILSVSQYAGVSWVDGGRAGEDDIWDGSTHIIIAASALRIEAVALEMHDQD